jgi:hypothetical protein
MGAVYGPGLLPCLPYCHDLSEQQQVDFLCAVAALDLMPMFHEVLGGVVYRITSDGHGVKIQPIPAHINDRVLQDVQRLTGVVPEELLEWADAGLWLPGSRSRRNRMLVLPGYGEWRVRDIRDGHNTLKWLHQEAQENMGLARPRGYTARVGERVGFEALVAGYEQLLGYLQYCEKFRFVCRLGMG